MKKLLFLLITIFCGICTLKAQNEEDYDYAFDGSVLESYHLATRPSIQTPDVAAFQKVTQIPVSNYTGRANISIPIYTIKSGNMSVPISLTYNTSGVKVADMPSSVGSNWALSAGGVVTKLVKGLDDFTPAKYKSIPSGHSISPGGLLIDHIIPGNTNSEQQNDVLPDIYNVNAPGLDTKFLHKKNGTVLEIEHKGNIIETDFDVLHHEPFKFGDTSFSITAYGLSLLNIKNLNGIEYTFATPEITHSLTTEPFGSFQDTFDANFGILNTNAYKLDRVFDTNTNKEITFGYTTYQNSFRDRFSYRPGIRTSSYPVKTNQLSDINFEEGSVSFIYDLDREDYTGEKALTEIIVKNHLDVIIKHFKLEYSYFQSTINPTTPQSKRLRLDRVYEVSTNDEDLANVGDYVLTYNTSVDMPPRDSWAHDFLGYNNGVYDASNTYPIPKLYYVESAYWNNFFDDDSEKNGSRLYTPFNNGTLPIDDGNFSLEANEEASKAYILTSIKYPTGGITTLEYESNTFGVRKGGGLRIKSQETTDEYGVSQIQNYSYSSGGIIKMPKFVTYHDKNSIGGAFRKYNAPQGQIELTNNAFVGYSSVSVKNDYDNQSVNYQYFTNGHYPNIPSKKTLFGNETSESLAWRSLGQYSLFIDKDILRGKLHKKIVYDQNGMVVLKQEYEYLLKQFETIKFTFQNNLVNYKTVSTNKCYSDEGVYYRSCGGYDEEIAFPIERNLLVSVKTKVLENLHDESINTQSAGNYVETEKKYLYDSSYPRIKSEFQGHGILCDLNVEQGEDSCSGDSSSEFISKNYTYPTEDSPLWDKNNLNTPELITIANEKGVLKTEDHQYKDFGNGIVAIEKVDFTGNNGVTKSSSTITKRDEKRNVLEAVSLTNVATSYIYAYESRYLVCELVNVSYSELETAVAALNIPLQDLINSNSDSYITTKTDELRNYLNNAKVTSYTHKPLVGVTSITDVRGRKVTYQYDNYNRLEYVKDHDSNIISKNSYNYKN